VASARLVIDAAGLPAHFEFDQAPRHRRSPHPHRVAATGCRAAPGTIFCSAQTVLSFQVLPRFDTTKTVRAPRGPTTSGLLSAPVRTISSTITNWSRREHSADHIVSEQVKDAVTGLIAQVPIGARSDEHIDHLGVMTSPPALSSRRTISAKPRTAA